MARNLYFIYHQNKAFLLLGIFLGNSHTLPVDLGSSGSGMVKLNLGNSGFNFCPVYKVIFGFMIYLLDKKVYSEQVFGEREKKEIIKSI